MTDNQEDWIPLRQAVAEVAQAYAPFMMCEPADAIEIAQTAILRRLSFDFAQSRAKKWILHFAAVKDHPGGRQDEQDSPLIPSGFWAVYNRAETVLAEDWVAGEYSFSTGADSEANSFEFDAFGMALGVEVTRTGLPIIGDEGLGVELAGVAFQRASAKAMQARGGRPRKWDWDAAMCAIIAKANTPDGLPEGYGAQAEIGRMLALWFHDNQGGEPVQSEIGARAAKIVAAIEANRK